MRCVLSKADVYKIDTILESEYKIPSLLLMEEVGLKVALSIQKLKSISNKDNILILVTPGNNGGDGLTIARHLYTNGYKITIVLFDALKQWSEVFKANYAIVESLGIPVKVIDEDNFNVFKACVCQANVLIDALYGIGLNRILSESVIKALAICEALNAFKISVDIPSGLSCDNGCILGHVFRADITYTVIGPKIGFYLNDNEKYTGKIQVIPLDIPEECYQSIQSKTYLVSKNALKLLPKRYLNGHKGTYGHLAFIGSTTDMLGASVLFSKASLSLGIGKLSGCFQKAFITDFLKILPEVVTLNIDSFDELSNCDALACGFGLGQTKLAEGILEKLLKIKGKALLLDADALNLIAKHKIDLSHHRYQNLVITPHPKEFARMLGKSVQETLANRIDLARQFAQDNKVCLVLKGRKSIVATRDGQIFINPYDAPTLSRAGSGDILSGIIATFLAQGLSEKDASILGVLLHGIIGQIGLKHYGSYGCSAEHLIYILRQYLKNKSKSEKMRYL